MQVARASKLQNMSLPCTQLPISLRPCGFHSSPSIKLNISGIRQANPPQCGLKGGLDECIFAISSAVWATLALSEVASTTSDSDCLIVCMACSRPNACRELDARPMFTCSMTQQRPSNTATRTSCHKTERRKRSHAARIDIARSSGSGSPNPFHSLLYRNHPYPWHTALSFTRSLGHLGPLSLGTALQPSCNLAKSNKDHSIRRGIGWPTMQKPQHRWK